MKKGRAMKKKMTIESEVCEMWVCETCGAAFGEPKMIPFYRERFAGCPECDSYLITQDAMQCKYCECWYTDEDMYPVAGICKSCLDDLMCERHDLLVAYALEDVDAFAEFVSEKLDEEKIQLEGKGNAPKCCST